MAIILAENTLTKAITERQAKLVEYKADLEKLKALQDEEAILIEKCNTVNIDELNVELDELIGYGIELGFVANENAETIEDVAEPVVEAKGTTVFPAQEMV